jgi:hypothetical protein
MILISLWSPAYNSAWAYPRAFSNRQFVNFFYESALALKNVPAKKYDIYVVSWNQNDINKNYPGWIERILWIYDLFFDQKYNRSSLEVYNKDRKDTISFIYQEKDLINVEGDQILTDDIGAVYKYFPGAKQIKTISSQSGETLTVLDISKTTQKKLNSEE